MLAPAFHVLSVEKHCQILMLYKFWVEKSSTTSLTVWRKDQKRYITANVHHQQKRIQTDQIFFEIIIFIIIMAQTPWYTHHFKSSDTFIYIVGRQYLSEPWIGCLFFTWHTHNHIHHCFFISPWKSWYRVNIQYTLRNLFLQCLCLARPGVVSGHANSIFIMREKYFLNLCCPLRSTKCHRDSELTGTLAPMAPTNKIGPY